MAVTVVPPSFKAGAIGDIYKCSIRATTFFGDHVNTFHVRQVTAAPSGDVFGDIVATWNSAPKSAYLAIFPTTFNLVSMHVAEVDDLIKGLPSATIALTGSGTRVVSGDRLPGQNAALLDFKTGFSGRRGRGRNFIGTLFESDQQDGVVGSALRTLIEAYGNALRTTFTVGTALAQLCIFTLVTNSVTDVISSEAKLPVYTQRRRRQGVGS